MFILHKKKENKRFRNVERWMGVRKEKKNKKYENVHPWHVFSLKMSTPSRFLYENGLTPHDFFVKIIHPLHDFIHWLYLTQKRMGA